MTGLVWKAYLVSACMFTPMTETAFTSRVKCDEFVRFANNQNQPSDARAECWPAGKDE